MEGEEQALCLSALVFIPHRHHHGPLLSIWHGRSLIRAFLEPRVAASVQSIYIWSMFAVISQFRCQRLREAGHIDQTAGSLELFPYLQLSRSFDFCSYSSSFASVKAYCLLSSY